MRVFRMKKREQFKTEEIPPKEWQRRCDEFLNGWHLIKKYWETETEFQIKLAEHRLSREQKDLDKLEESHNELKSLTLQIEKELE